MEKVTNQKACLKCKRRFWCNTMDRSRGMGCIDIEEEGTQQTT
jgi:hypothetical protein